MITLYVYYKRNMANTSTIKSFDELTIQTISAIPKSQKRSDESCIYDNMMIVYSRKEWSTLKRIKLSAINLTKYGYSLYISKRDWETIFSPFDQTLLIISPNNSVSTLQDLQNNLSLKSNAIDSLNKFIDATFFKLNAKTNKEKKSDKQQQTQNIKDPILETLQDTVSILRTELAQKQKTIDTLKLTSQGIMHYLWLADLSKSFYQLIVSIFTFLNQKLITFSQCFFTRLRSVGLPHIVYIMIY